MNIYRKIAEAMRDPSVSAFVEEERIGLAEVSHIKEAVSQKEKQREFLNVLGIEDDYPFLAYKSKIEGFLADRYNAMEFAEPPKEVDADFAVPCFAAAMVKKIKPQEL